MKKIYFIFLCGFLYAATLHAQTKGATGNLAWSISGGTLTISGTGAMPNYGPGNAPWYKSNASITHVVIGDAVTAIGNFAFSSLSKLNAVTIPKSVTTVGNNAFYNCTALSAVTVQDGATPLAIPVDNTFANCPIETLYMGRNISFDYFYSPFQKKTTLKTITLGATVTAIGDGAFSDCSGLTSVTIPATVTYIGDNAFKNCTALTSVNIEDGTAPLQFGRRWLAFTDCPVETLYLGRNTTGIPQFNKCATLKKVTLGKGVTRIDALAFSECTALTSVVISASVTAIGDRAFIDCSSLASVTFEDGTTPLAFRDAGSVFNGCPVETLYAGRDISFERNPPFRGKNTLKTVTLGNMVTFVNNLAFNDCKTLSSVEINGSQVAIGDNAFDGCPALSSVIINSMQVTIGDNAFANCAALTNDVVNGILAKTTSVGSFVFTRCTGLTAVVVPASVKNVGADFFKGCTGLTSVTFQDETQALSLEQLTKTEENINALTAPVIDPITKLTVTPKTKTIYITKHTSGHFSCGLLPVFNPAQPGGGAWGFLDTEGNVAIDYKFKGVEGVIPQFSENVCAIPLWNTTYSVFEKDGSMLIDTKGATIAIMKEYHAISAFSAGVATAMRQKSQYATRYAIYINKKGEHIFQHLTFEIPQFENIRPGRALSEGLMAFYDYGKRKWGFINLSGTIVIPAQYREVRDFHEGLAAVQLAESPNYWGYIDNTGKMVIQPKFSKKPYSFSHGYAIAVKTDQSMCYIDKTGNIALDGLLNAGPFYKGLAFIAVDDGAFLIDRNFNRLKKSLYALFAPRTEWDAYEISEDLSLTKHPGTGRDVIVDYRGNLIANLAITANFYDGRAHAYMMKPDGIYRTLGFVNKQGEFVFIFKDSEF